jgi:hypothetical protein
MYLARYLPLTKQSLSILFVKPSNSIRHSDTTSRSTNLKRLSLKKSIVRIAADVLAKAETGAGISNTNTFCSSTVVQMAAHLGRAIAISISIRVHFIKRLLPLLRPIVAFPMLCHGLGPSAVMKRDDEAGPIC